jgi:histidine ammonia-lyase
VAAVMERLRRDVPRREHDRYLAPDMAAVERLVAGGDLVAAAESVVGGLA